MDKKDYDRDPEKNDHSTITSTATSARSSTVPVDASLSGLTGTPDTTVAAALSSSTEEAPESSQGNLSRSGPPVSPDKRAISIRSETRTAVPVPRAERRGLLARFAIIAEVEEPKDYTRRTKWIITFIVAVAGAAAPMGSGILLPALHEVTLAFSTTPTVTNLNIALYMLSMSIFPLWWSSFSETLGRRTIYLTSFALFLLFNILSAVSTNIAMFIVMRILSGGAAASVQAVGAGTIADLWEVKERGRAMGMFYLGPLCGPLLSPIIGGALSQGLGWRSSMWFLVFYGGVLILGLLFFLPETLKQRIDVVAEAEKDAVQETVGADGASLTLSRTKSRPSLHRTPTRQSVQITTRKYAAILRRCFLDPLRIILYLRFPAVAITVYYASITFGTLYALNISVQQTFSRPPYNFGTTVVGLLYIPNSLGYVLASIFGGRWVDAIMLREARKAGRYGQDGKLQFRPEDRMKENAWMAGVMFPAALVWYGWTAEKGVHWIVPMIANFFFGIGSMLVFAMATTMLTEFMPQKSSHGIAVNNFVRNIFSCVGGVVAEPLIVAIGDGWLFTGLGVIAFVSGIAVILAMKRFGARWRVRMDREMGT
ncbi:hypothetical protein LTR66_008133 [Elasticomyces elasticus]|nr:hypothetical protein LTR66_008133 [Elasticomyces elasticus]